MCRQIHTCCGGYLMMYNISYSNTLHILCIRIINLEYFINKPPILHSILIKINFLFFIIYI